MSEVINDGLNEVLKEAWDNARSIESYDIDVKSLEEVGRVSKTPEKEYILYRDKASKYWYRTEYLTNSGRISEYEHVFGKKPPRRRR